MTPETERLSQETCTIKEAREIMGSQQFFGPDEWNRHFINFNLTKIPAIPWTKDELRRPGLTQQHFLFLGLKSLNGEEDEKLTRDGVLSLKDYLINQHEIPDVRLQVIPSGALLTDRQGKTYNQKIQTRWYFMPVGTIRGLERWSEYGSLVAGLPKSYKVPSATEFILGNTLYYLLNHKFMVDKSRPALTNEYVKGHNDFEHYYNEGIAEHYNKKVWVNSMGTVISTETKQGGDILLIIDGKHPKGQITIAASLKLP